jgi:hypothetical protein
MTYGFRVYRKFTEADRSWRCVVCGSARRDGLYRQIREMMPMQSSLGVADVRAGGREASWILPSSGRPERPQQAMELRSGIQQIVLQHRMTASLRSAWVGDSEGSHLKARVYQLTVARDTLCR